MKPCETCRDLIHDSADKRLIAAPGNALCCRFCGRTVLQRQRNPDRSKGAPNHVWAEVAPR